ncbi:hypothetical protein BT69DRAFT_1279181 [Atractiella rhizophila]|nr:hypothetical protein BT69DRAFT_1279181 [Atractiella rhizophila]
MLEETQVMLDEVRERVHPLCAKKQHCSRSTTTCDTCNGVLMRSTILKVLVHI